MVRRWKAGLAAECMVLILVPGAFGAEPASGPAAAAPPAYTLVRWNENYAYLRNAPNTDFWDPIKYIPLNDAGDWYLSLGGQARYRYEYFDDFLFDPPSPPGPKQDDNGYHLTRFLGHADLHLGQNVRAFVQLKSSLEDGREGGPRASTDEDVFDVQQAFVDLVVPVDDASVLLRGGRQDLIYGAQRLISPLDWTNTRRTFEGFKSSFTLKQHALDLFLVRPVIVERFESNTGDGDTTFGGAYYTVGLPNVLEKANTRLEVYGLGLFTRPVGPADQDRYTIGSRFSTNPKPWDFDVEADYQFGDQGSGDISAWSFATDVGYTVADCPMTPRLNLGFDIASGDDDPADADNETFNQLFPLGHAYFGFIDVIGRQNIIDLHPGVAIKPHKDVKLSLDYHWFWRQSTDDAVYNAAGAVLRADTGTDARFIGSELDLLLTWQIDRHLYTYLGYSHFFAGDFIEDTGVDEDIDFVYVAVQYTF